MLIIAVIIHTVKKILQRDNLQHARHKFLRRSVYIGDIVKRGGVGLDEKELLRRLRRGDTDALQQAIDAYSGYVYAIVKNIIQPPLQPEDIEEVVSDVFLRLWDRAGDVEAGHLRAWLAAVTRNRAKDKLRNLHLSLPLEEDTVECVTEGPEEAALRREARRTAREAVETLPEPDRSIFLRYYYFYQKTDEIAAALALKPATVRARLSRGRERLKTMLMERGIGHEAAYQ